MALTPGARLGPYEIQAPLGAGDTIFYLNPRSGELTRVDVMPGAPPRFGSPRRIYAGPLDFLTIHIFDLVPVATSWKSSRPSTLVHHLS